jgi:hypothetical protein
MNANANYQDPNEVIPMSQTFLPARALSIRDAEYQALVEFRQMLVAGAVVHDPACDCEKPVGFNMNIISDTTDCGTTCCIGGWMFRFMMSAGTCDFSPRDTLYVNHDRSRALVPLFFPFKEESEDGEEHDFPLDLIPPEFALNAVDNFLTTGRPNWPNVCGIENLEVSHA